MPEDTAKRIGYTLAVPLLKTFAEKAQSCRQSDEVMMTPILFVSFLLVLNVNPSIQVCSESRNSTYKIIADNLWAAHELRKALFASLFEARSHTDNSVTYFTLSAILDALRRRHIDLYPVLPQLPKLNKIPPRRQVKAILSTLVSDPTVGSAVEEVMSELRRGGLVVQRNITENIKCQLKPGLSRSLDEVLEIIGIHIQVCPPPQSLVGAILMSLPVRTRVAEARTQVSQMLKEHSLPTELWRNITSGVSVKDRTIKTWLSDIVREVADHTTDVEGTEDVAAGILLLDDKPKWGAGDARRMETEEIAPRLHPGKISGYFSPKEDKDVYKIGLEEPPPSQSTYWPEIPVPGRMRRSASKVGKEATFEISPALKDLSSAIANYTMSLLNLKFGAKRDQGSKTQSTADFQLLGGFFKQSWDKMKTFYATRKDTTNKRFDRPEDKVSPNEATNENVKNTLKIPSTSPGTTLESPQMTSPPELNLQENPEVTTMSRIESNRNSQNQNENETSQNKSHNSQAADSFGETRKTMERLHNFPLTHNGDPSENVPSSRDESNTFQDKGKYVAETPLNESSQIEQQATGSNIIPNETSANSETTSLGETNQTSEEKALNKLQAKPTARSGDVLETSDGFLKKTKPETPTQIEPNQYSIPRNDQTMKSDETPHEVAELENKSQVELNGTVQEEMQALTNVQPNGQDTFQRTPTKNKLLTISLDKAIHQHLKNKAEEDPTNSSLLSFLPSVSEEDATLLQPFKEFLNAHLDTDGSIESIVKLLLNAKPPKDTILEAVIDSYIFHLAVIFKKKLAPEEREDASAFFDYAHAQPELGKLGKNPKGTLPGK